jgi:2-C-methyl-D-erythritol 4-phosphate cytidylyltransferase
VAAAQQSGAAILVAPVIDTIKEVSDSMIVRTLDRENLRHALTPQCFRYDLLRKAYEMVDVNDVSLTDESSLIERLGEEVMFVEGSGRNMKITTQRDLVLAEALLKVVDV